MPYHVPWVLTGPSTAGFDPGYGTIVQVPLGEIQ